MLINLNKFLRKKVFYILFLLFILIISFIIYNIHKKSIIIPENKKTCKFKLQPNLFHDNLNTEFLFEPEDISYYEKTFIPLPEQIIFHHETPETNATIQVPELDKQNVHDSFVNKYIRKIYDNCNHIQYTTNITDEIKAITDNQNIHKVLNELTIRNADITNLGDTCELDVLASIWNVAKNNDNIKDMFLTQLSDCVNETDNVVCPTGIVNRLTISLIVEDPDLFPKTESMINDEILQTASVIRSELELNPLYIELNDESQNSEFKNKLMNRITNDYQGIIEVDKLEKIIEPWIDFI